MDDKEENWDPVDIPTTSYLLGFLIIPTCAKCVSVGKSFVESSNLE